MTKGIFPKICRLCVCIIINKRSLQTFMCLDLEKKKTDKSDQCTDEVGWVFSLDLKEKSEVECLTAKGREFHITGPMH